MRKVVGSCARGKTVTFAVVDNSVSVLHDITLRFSSWTKICNTIVYVLRFLKILPTNTHVTASDLALIERYIFREVQKIHFNDDFRLIQQNKIVKPSFRSFSPFIKDNLISVGGRLAHSNLSYDYKHPYLLPKTHHIVNLNI